MGVVPVVVNWTRGCIMRIRSASGVMIVGVAMIVLAGCGAVLGAGAGAGAAIAYNERGVSSTVTNSVEDVFNASRAVFAEMGITETETEIDDRGAERELKGTRNNLSITVDIEEESPSLTSIEVFARESRVEWDRDYARNVLAGILDRL